MTTIHQVLGYKKTQIPGSSWFIQTPAECALDLQTENLDFIVHQVFVSSRTHHQKPTMSNVKNSYLFTVFVIGEENVY